MREHVLGPISCSREFEDWFHFPPNSASVYAALHELLHNHNNIAKTLSKYSRILSILDVKHSSLCAKYFTSPITEFVCYDDGCHLKNFARNPCRAHLTPISAKLASLEIVVDKMHIQTLGANNIMTQNYFRNWTMWANFNQSILTLLHLHVHLTYRLTQRSVNSIFPLSKYSRMTRQMEKSTFLFFLLYTIDMHNRRNEQKLFRAGFN